MIIGISGKARSGKDQFAEYLIAVFSSEHAREFKVTAFAHRLKQMCLEHFNLSRDQLWGNEKEEEDERYPYVVDLKLYKDGPLHWTNKGDVPMRYWTPREIMQELGSFYRKIDYGFWVRKVDEKWKYADCPDLVITDVRHINECEYVKKHGALIKVVRGEHQDIHGMAHESEVSLDNRPDDYFDIVVHNDGTLDDLRLAARNTAGMLMKLQNFKEKETLYNGS